MQTSLLWFRNDLRLADNATLAAAVKSSSLLPVYCIDPREWQAGKYVPTRMSPARARFLLETLTDLRRSLQDCGSDLLVIHESPVTAIPWLMQEFNCKNLFYSESTADEERRLERQLRQMLQPLGMNCYSFWQGTLYHKDDLPFSIEQLPDVFTQFRKMVEKYGKIRPSLPDPERLPSLPAGVQCPPLPTLVELNVQSNAQQVVGVLPFKGGEIAAFTRLEEYFFDRDCLRSYKETRNGLLGADYSSKFSAWLANGSISPRMIYEEVRNYEEERVKNDSTYWLIFELLWRDYFQFVAYKFGSALFKPTGILGKSVVKSRFDNELFSAWMQGRTGVPFIDANMRELAQTGFMSNRGRQNVASFLVKDIGLPWLAGAEYFESALIDYDPAANYGNWNYVAGVGNDPRENRYFNVLRQASMYDAKGDYVRYWLPELQNIAPEYIHTPWKQNNSLFQQQMNYPLPIIDIEHSIRRNS